MRSAAIVCCALALTLVVGGCASKPTAQCTNSRRDCGPYGVCVFPGARGENYCAVGCGCGDGGTSVCDGDGGACPEGTSCHEVIPADCAVCAVFTPACTN